MKIAGIDPKTLSNEVLLVLPRGETNLVFRAVAVPHMDEFNALCPQPKPPGKYTKDGWVPSLDDPTYQQVQAAWAKKHLGYIVMKSLAPSQIEWDTVKESDPRTWPAWELDLLGAGLSQVEAGRVLRAVLEANSLDDAKLEKARAAFLCWSGSDAGTVLWPTYRSEEYAIWRACERLGILPPGVKPAWDEMGVEAQALVIAFNQTREYDESEREAQWLGAGMPRA